MESELSIGIHQLENIVWMAFCVSWWINLFLFFLSFQLYTSDYNSQASCFDFKKALDLLQFVDRVGKY